MKIYWDGVSKNIIGQKVKELRLSLGLSQARLAEQLQLLGMECNSLTILRIEKGERFVSDMELLSLAEFFHLTPMNSWDERKPDNNLCP